MNEKFCYFFLALFGLLNIAWTSPVDFLYNLDFENSHLDEQEAAIRERIPEVVTIVNPVYNPAVRSYLNTYIYRRPEFTNAMLGWSKYYFPIFEKALEEEGLPCDLKYLAIVESALNPNALSRSGAGGLWQFMKPTAKECGLKCGTYVDERMDPSKSSKAAAHYLKQLYNMFGNWELVMAAYNAGPGRVRSAVKRAGSTDYWKVCKYLPLETRSYVPGFIAASYLANFYYEHNLSPVDPEHVLGELTQITLHEGIHLSELARRSGLTVDLVKALNPSFVRNYIPASNNGYIVWLPVASAEYFNSGVIPPAPIAITNEMAMTNTTDSEKETIVVSGELYRIKTVKKYYTVRSGDNLYNISNRHGCTVKQLMSWNGLHSSRIGIGQRLELRKEVRELIPVVVEKVELAMPVREDLTLAMIPSLMHVSFKQEKISLPVSFEIQPDLPVQTDNSIVLKRRQCLRQALGATQIGAGISTSQVVMPNNLATGDVVRLRTKA